MADEVETYVITSGWDAVTMTLTRTSGPSEPLTDAEKNLLAWQGPFPPCRTCGQTRNHRCVSTVTPGKFVQPHQHRKDMAEGYLGRSAEVDALKSSLEAEAVTRVVQQKAQSTDG